MEGSSYQFVVYGKTYYVKGKAFFEMFAQALPADMKAMYLSRIGDNWVSLGPIGAEGLGGLGSFLDKAVLADCLDAHGTLSKAGTETVQGQKAVVLADKGDFPGGAPAKLYVRVNSPNYPLRLTQGGTVTPGTPTAHGKCPARSSDPGSMLDDVTLDLSDFDTLVTVVQPPNAVDLSQLLPLG
jgi:hypothetical protein